MVTINEAIITLEELKEECGCSCDELAKQRAETLDLAIMLCRKSKIALPLVKYDRSKQEGNWKILCPTCGEVLMERVTTDEGSEPIYYNMTGHCRCGQRISKVWENIEELEEWYDDRSKNKCY